MLCVQGLLGTCVCITRDPNKHEVTYCEKMTLRESDYGIVAREFEAAVDEYLYNASLQPVLNGIPLPPGRLPAAAGKTSASDDNASRNDNAEQGLSVPPKSMARAPHKLPVGRPPKNKMASATTEATPSAASIPEPVAATLLATTSKAGGKKTK